jgi:hypothetical protein
MDLFALVASDSDFAVDLYSSLALAERALADALGEEPAFAELLTVETVGDPGGGPSLN